MLDMLHRAFHPTRKICVDIFWRMCYATHKAQRPRPDKIQMAQNATEKQEDEFMALTKAQVKEIFSAAGVSPENMDSAVTKIIEGHVASIDALREERDGFKKSADRLADVEKELAEAKKRMADADSENWKEKYDGLKDEYDGYKSRTEKAAAHEAKAKAYEKLLASAGVSEKRIAAVLKVTDVDALELESDGSLKGAEKLAESVKAEWADFIVTQEQQGAQTATPPGNDGGGAFDNLTLAEKMQFANEHPNDASVKAWLQK